MTDDTDDRPTRGRHRYATCPEALIDDPDVSGQAIRLYLLLDRYAGNNDAAWPGRATLAARLGWSDATVTRLTAELVAAGWIKRRRRMGRSALTFVCTIQGETAPWEDDHSASYGSDLRPRTAQIRADERRTDAPREENPKGPNPNGPADSPHPSSRTDLTRVDVKWAIENWPTGVGGKTDARREWPRALRRCGNALDLADAVVRLVEVYADPHGPDPQFCWSLVRWLRNDGWNEPLPARKLVDVLAPENDKRGPKPPHPLDLPEYAPDGTRYSEMQMVARREAAALRLAEWEANRG